jgi:hypothetical protein
MAMRQARAFLFRRFADWRTVKCKSPKPDGERLPCNDGRIGSGLFVTARALET